MRDLEVSNFETAVLVLVIPPSSNNPPRHILTDLEGVNLEVELIGELNEGTFIKMKRGRSLTL